MARVKDMTKGSPLKLILGFALPLMFGNIFQQLYSMVDTIVVGRVVGGEALASVGKLAGLACIGDCDGNDTGLWYFNGAEIWGRGSGGASQKYHNVCLFIGDYGSCVYDCQPAYYQAAFRAFTDAG